MHSVPSLEKPTREPVLNQVDRVSEMLFGLFMALTFVGAVSVADQGDAQIRTMFIAALGCNLAWGLVDAVMYLVRTITDRGRLLTLIRSVRNAPDAEAGRLLIARSMSKVAAGLVSTAEIEAIRGRIVALASLPGAPCWVALPPTIAVPPSTPISGGLGTIRRIPPSAPAP